MWCGEVKEIIPATSTISKKILLLYDGSLGTYKWRCLTNTSQVSPNKLYSPNSSAGAQEDICGLCMGMPLQRKGPLMQKSNVAPRLTLIAIFCMFVILGSQFFICASNSFHMQNSDTHLGIFRGSIFGQLNVIRKSQNMICLIESTFLLNLPTIIPTAIAYQMMAEHS